MEEMIIHRHMPSSETVVCLLGILISTTRMGEADTGYRH